MKKISKKLLSLVLSATVLISATACSGGGISGVFGWDKPENPNEKLSVYEGTHIFTAPDTDDFLVKNGVSNYVVVVPENASEYELTAKEEFVHLFKKATNIELRTTTDAGLTHDANARYISIGKTALLASANLEVNNSLLGNDGGRVVTKDKSVYIFGGGDTGTLFMVYTFMDITFNYETYYFDCMEIDTNVKYKPLKAYDVTDVPDFKFRATNNHILTEAREDYDENNFKNRMRYVGGRGYDFMPVHGNAGKNEYNDKEPVAFGVRPYTDQDGVPADNSTAKSTNSTVSWIPHIIYNDSVKYPQAYHPLWFSSEGNEICYTAHGDEAELEALLDECFWKVTYSLQKYTPEKYPEYGAMTLTQQDNTQYCRCKTCTDKAEELGGIVGVYIEFMNELGARVDAWMNDPENAAYKRDDFKLLFFAYSYTQQAPVEYNAETGEYEPLIKCHPRVGAYFATKGERQEHLSSEGNEEFLQNIDNWGLVTNTLHYWFYRTNFKNYMWFVDCFDYFTPEFFSHMATRSTEKMFIQGQEACKGTLSNFNNLQLYLEAKLAWNSALDYGTLIDDFFNAMYREAAPAVKKIWLQVRANMQGILEYYKIPSTAANRIDFADPKYWPLAKHEAWLKELDEAKKLVARYETLDPELYEDICQHIEAECIGVLYNILDCNYSFLTTEQKNEYFNRLRYDIEWMGLEQMTTTEQSTATIVSWLDGLS